MFLDKRDQLCSPDSGRGRRTGVTTKYEAGQKARIRSGKPGVVSQLWQCITVKGTSILDHGITFKWIYPILITYSYPYEENSPPRAG